MKLQEGNHFPTILVVTVFSVSIQAHQVEAQKRKGVDENNPTLYWEYKWTEDADAEVFYLFS